MKEKPEQREEEPKRGRERKMPAKGKLVSSRGKRLLGEGGGGGGGGGTATAEKPKTSADGKANRLQKELAELSLKHRQESYWLKLELDTIRKEKQAVEDRMAELYRDVQEMQEEKKDKNPRRPIVLDAEYVADLHRQIDKNARMFRIMNNQIALVRSSSDNVVRSLKAEISDLMDEKGKVEMDLMNQLAQLDREKQDLAAHLGATGAGAGVGGSVCTSSVVSGDAHSINAGTTITAPLSLRSSMHSSPGDLGARTQHSTSAAEKSLKSEIQRLKRENRRLGNELSKERKQGAENARKWEQERSALSTQVQKFQHEMDLLKSSKGNAERLTQLQGDREETLATLDRVATLWDRADESMQSLEMLVAELRPTDDRVHEVDQDRERLLSTMETASLVQGQVKVSLMLIELKLRNSLACLTNDQVQLGAFGADAAAIHDRIATIQKEAMTAIDKVERALHEQVSDLGRQAASETRVVRETLQSKVADLKRMKSRQQILENEITKLQHNDDEDEEGVPAAAITGTNAATATTNAAESNATNRDSAVVVNGGDVDGGESKEGANEEGGPSVELFVSRKVLERLQEEVLQVVERVKEKTATIGRLTAIVEEHKVRERALMDELRRHMQEQAERQARETAQGQTAAWNGGGYDDDDDDEYEYEEEILEDDEEDEVSDLDDESSLYEEATIEDFVEDTNNTNMDLTKGNGAGGVSSNRSL